jgi:hypothetical protein
LGVHPGKEAWSSRSISEVGEIDLKLELLRSNLDRRRGALAAFFILLMTIPDEI